MTCPPPTPPQRNPPPAAAPTAHQPNKHRPTTIKTNRAHAKSRTHAHTQNAVRRRCCRCLRPPLHDAHYAQCSPHCRLPVRPHTSSHPTPKCPSHPTQPHPTVPAHPRTHATLPTAQPQPPRHHGPPRARPEQARQLGHRIAPAPTQQHATRRAGINLRPPPATTTQPTAHSANATTLTICERSPPASPQPAPDTTTAQRPATSLDVRAVYVARNPRRATGNHPSKPTNNARHPKRAVMRPPPTPPHRQQPWRAHHHAMRAGYQPKKHRSTPITPRTRTHTLKMLGDAGAAAASASPCTTPTARPLVVCPFAPKHHYTPRQGNIPR